VAPTGTADYQSAAQCAQQAIAEGLRDAYVNRNLVSCCRTYKNCKRKGLQHVNGFKGQSHQKWLYWIGHISLPISGLSVATTSILHSFGDTTTFTAYVIALRSPSAPI